MNRSFCSPQRAPRITAPARMLWVALLGLLLVGTACDDAGQGNGEGTALGYQVGEPLSDTTLASIARTEGYADTLTAEMFRTQMNQLTRGRLAMLQEEQRQQVQRIILQRFMDATALRQEARQRELSVESATVDQRLQMIRSRVGDSLFQARLAQTGLTRAQVRENIRQGLLMQKVREAIASEAEQPSAQQLTEYSQEQAREVRIQQILFPVPPGASPAQRDSVERVAASVLDSAKSDVSFDSLASRYGQGQMPQSGYQNRQAMAAPFSGPRGRRPPEDISFVQTAFALQDSGAVVDEPVRTRFGYHLIRKTGERRGEPMDTSQARQRLMQGRKQEQLRTTVERLREDVTLRVNPQVVTVDMSQPPDTTAGQSGSS